MRKVILFNMVSADGYFEGRHADISWHRVDTEVNEFIIDQLKTTDTLIFGRKTFQVMEAFWPTPQAIEPNPEVAERMTRYKKIVFSKSINRTDWQNTQFIEESPAKTVSALKKEPGKNIFVFGSGNLCKSLIKADVIDEFRLMVNPVTLGKGTPFFHVYRDLALLKTRVFGCGNVLLCYGA